MDVLTPATLHELALLVYATVYKIVALAKPGSDADDRTTTRDT